MKKAFLFFSILASFLHMSIPLSAQNQAKLTMSFKAYSSFCRLFFCIRCSIAHFAGWLYSEYSKSLYTFAMQSEA